MRRLSSTLLALALLAPALSHSQPQVVEAVNYEFSFFLLGHKVWLNGAGSAEMAQSKAYTAGLYLVKPARTLEEALAAPGPKRLRLNLLRDIETTQLGSHFSKAMSATMSSSELAACASGLAELGQIFGSKKRLVSGDELALDGIPTQGTHFTLNGQRMATIKHNAFFGCLMRGYLGPKSPDAALRGALLKPSSTPRS